jgi:L-iditol 2-dehydrogenase
MVKTRSVGVCGSDLHWYLDGRIGHRPCVFPLILGHEPVAEIAAVGAGVPESRVGERVFVEPAMNCGRCEFCLGGNTNLCPHVRFLGSSPVDGLFREYGVVPAHNCIPAPEGLPDAVVTLIEPLAVILHVVDLAPIAVGATVAVLGAGPIGLLCVAVAKLSGAGRILACDKVPHRLEMARTMGADTVVNNAAASFRDAVMDETGGRGADVVLDAAAFTETINMGINITRRGGRYVLVGLPTERELNIDLHTAMANETRIVTIKRSNFENHAAMELLRTGRVPGGIITHRVPLERTPEIFDTLANYRDGVGKVVIEVAR